MIDMANQIEIDLDTGVGVVYMTKIVEEGVIKGVKILVVEVDIGLEAEINLIIINKVNFKIIQDKI